MNHSGYNLPTRALVKNDSNSMIERPDVQRSRFINNWTHNTTFDAGYLVPFMVEEILPGDMMQYNVQAYVRMSTPLFPMFDNQKIDTFFFFVPNRLLWDNWERFMGYQKDPADSIDFLIPQLDSPVDGFPVGSLGDYFGLPTEGQLPMGASISVNSLPWRAYALIFNEWFRDQNSQDSMDFETGDGPDVIQPGLVRRNKLHDYFTTSLPWLQKFASPSVPLFGQIPVSGIGVINQDYPRTSGSWYQPGGTLGTFPNYLLINTDIDLAIRGTAATGGFPDVFVDLANGAGVALNALRQTWMVQSLLERDARGGTRYTEIVRSHFGVVSPDMRLQRPEYIGGGSTPLTLTPVAQTAPTVGVPVGALGAAGTSIGNHRASYASTEHGIIIGLINVQSELSYQQGIPRYFSRRTREDLYWPSFAHLGEQAVLRKEIYAQGIADDDVVFGYQERYHEYRSRYSHVTGMFRSTATGTLDAWHLSQRFNAPPVLGATFLADTPPMARVLAAAELAENQQYLASINISLTATRPIPMYGTPAALGRF